jgi:hypothetical protein
MVSTTPNAKFNVGQTVEFRYKKGTFLDTGIGRVDGVWLQYGVWRYSIRFNSHYYKRYEDELKPVW